MLLAEVKVLDVSERTEKRMISPTSRSGRPPRSSTPATVVRRADERTECSTPSVSGRAGVFVAESVAICHLLLHRHHEAGHLVGV